MEAGRSACTSTFATGGTSVHAITSIAHKGLRARTRFVPRTVVKMVCFFAVARTPARAHRWNSFRPFPSSLRRRMWSRTATSSRRCTHAQTSCVTHPHPPILAPCRVPAEDVSGSMVQGNHQKRQGEDGRMMASTSAPPPCRCWIVVVGRRPAVEQKQLRGGNEKKKARPSLQQLEQQRLLPVCCRSSHPRWQAARAKV